MAPLACRLFGHALRFEADGAVMRWTCERRCDEQGEKRYASAEEAARYASAFDDDDREAMRRRPVPGIIVPRRGDQDG